MAKNHLIVFSWLFHKIHVSRRPKLTVEPFCL